ncbi:trigger factor [uncultured Clostridium sp.]|uniref:trigger factor n=1 Tax=uncultured Clostridium sp. TaxID=59620 RepID=UPI002606FA45|nr:trigger factor [uncultured Clostridium sp.]
MEIKMENIETNIVELEIKVEAKKFEGALEKAFRKNAKSFNIPGFRKGKVTLNMVKKFYGVEVLYNDAIEICVESTYAEAVDAKELHPVDYPAIEVVEVGEGKDLVYKAKVTVMPEVKLGDYKALEVTAPKKEDISVVVERELSNLQEKNSRTEEKTEGVVEKGNIAVIDFKGFVENEAFEGGEGKDYSLEIGSGSFIGNFEEQLEGLKVGDSKDVVVTFPVEYGKEELNGKEAKFEVTINKIEVKDVPALDDEFASEVSEFETLVDLKADLTKKAEEMSEARIDNELKELVINKAVDNATIEIPAVMLEKETDTMIQNLEQRLSQQGLNLVQYYELTGSTEEKMREYMKENAERKVKTDLVLSEITKVEKLEVTEEELKAKALEVAAMYAAEAEKIAEMLMTTQKQALEADVLRVKTVAVLVDSAKTV